MTFLRMMFLGFACSALLSWVDHSTAFAQVPRKISYQGFLIKDGKSLTGAVDLDLKIYDGKGNVLYSESDSQVPVINGIFNVFIGSTSGGLPSGLTFNEPYFLGIDVDHKGEVSPRTPFVSAPYALNSETVGGFGVSVTPEPGKLLPLDSNGKFPRSVLPLPLNITGSMNPGSNTGFTGRAGSGSGVIAGKIYVVGGEGPGGGALNTFEVYDPKTDSWSSPGPSGTFTGRRYLTASVIGNKLYAFGGVTSSGTSVQPSNILEVYDASTNSWSTPQTTGTFTARYGLSSNVVNGKIYVMGGYDGTKATNTLEIFDPATNTWTTPATVGQMTPRLYHTSAVVNGKIYVIGGGDVASHTIDPIEVFDPATNSWSTLKTTAWTPRWGLASAVINNIIYTMDGTANGSNFLNTFEAFDPLTNAWSLPLSPNTSLNRELVCANAIGNKIYIMEGWNGDEVVTNEIFTQAP